MKIPKEVRKLFDKMNKRYKVFKTKGVRSNLWDMVQNELLNVYMDFSERTGKDISRLNFKQNVFSLRNDLDQEALQQIYKIAKFAEKSKSSSFAYYKKNSQYDDSLFKQYQTIKQQAGFGISDLQDYIDFIDEIENGALDKELFDRLGSKLYRFFYAYCKNKKISNKDYNDVVERGLATSLTGDPLYNWLRDEVNKAYSVVSQNK